MMRVSGRQGIHQPRDLPRDNPFKTLYRVPSETMGARGNSARTTGGGFFGLVESEV
jgi:hypothetical protein